MSVAQVKKRFAEMTEYLNRDKEGLRRLKLLKDDVNVLRTSLATAEEAAQLAVTIKDSARERADVAEAELAELRLQVQSLGLKNQSLTQQVASLTQEVSKLYGEDVEAPVEQADGRSASVSEVVRVIRALRKRRPNAPTPVREATDLITTTEFYDRNDIAKGWSHESLWILGASVATLTLYLGQMVIFSSESLSDAHINRDAVGRLRESLQPYSKWLPKTINPVLKEEGIITVAEMLCDRDGLGGDML